MQKIEYFFTNKSDGDLRIENNKKALEKKYDIKFENLIYMNQVHKNSVQIVDANSPRFIENCDGLITNTRNLTLMVMVADCIPIIFMDKIKGVVAAVHAGRNSTFLKIASITAKKMIAEFSCEPLDIEVFMGPSIKKCCYEVNDELKNIVKTNFGEEFIKGENIDLQGINKMLLNDIGVENISIANICTKCSNEPYFSYRVDKKCGRFAGLVTIK